METFAFDFWLTKSMIRPDLSFENAQDVDGEVVASLIREVTQSEISFLKAWDSNRDGVWKLPATWHSFSINPYLDGDYAFAIDSEYGDGKVLDAATTFDAKMIVDIEGTIAIEAENFSQARNKLLHQVIDDLWDAVDNYDDLNLRNIFYSGKIILFEFSPTSENDEYERLEDFDEV